MSKHRKISFLISIRPYPGKTIYFILSLLVFCFLLFSLPIKLLSGDQVFTPKDLLNLKYVTEAEISADGERIAYTVRVPRKPGDKPGEAYNELFVVSVNEKKIVPFYTGKIKIRSIAWKPDGTAIAFLMKKDDKSKRQIWVIPVDGREARQITGSETDIKTFRWHPSGRQIFYTAKTPETEKEKYLCENGYGFKFHEEDWKHRNLYSIDISAVYEGTNTQQITRDITIWDFQISPDGNTVAAAVTKKNLIDYKYMFQKIHLINPKDNTIQQLTNNPGKLGNFDFNSDGTYLVYAAALELSDHAVSQVYVIPTTGGEAKNLTIPDFKGHVEWVGWKDKKTVLYYSGEGVYPTLRTVDISGEKREIILHSKGRRLIFKKPSYTVDFENFALICSAPAYPRNLFYWSPGEKLKRLTHVNPWLMKRNLGKQEIIQYPARDGLTIEGLLIYPVDYSEGTKYPLVVVVHGGPESHYSNCWLTYYSRPGQVLSGKGYTVFYPNYRASTGYGVNFASQGFGDAAGREYDDIADGIDYLIRRGIVDWRRVGLGGGSYGGFAAAWFGSYYTHYVKAVCMFVGISDLISKRSTTDIPYEELYVHSGEPLEEMWDFSLKRSPIYWAHKSKTAYLIYGGTDDTRVHPSQSLEMFRRLKMNNHPAVRLVQYPGEKHGNRKQPGRIDVLYRTLEWYDWYVRDNKPIDGPMPPLDISEKYGLELPGE